jgi:UDP-N-acetylglucosamine 4,6-dehydratase
MASTFVVHAATRKPVPAVEYNPIEVVRMNIGGAENVINAAIDRGVKRVMAIRSDQALAM